MLAALSGGQSFIPSTYIRQHTAKCTFSSKGSNKALVWPLQIHVSYKHTHNKHLTAAVWILSTSRLMDSWLGLYLGLLGRSGTYRKVETLGIHWITEATSVEEILDPSHFFSLCLLITVI